MHSQSVCALPHPLVSFAFVYMSPHQRQLISNTKNATITKSGKKRIHPLQEIVGAQKLQETLCLAGKDPSHFTCNFKVAREFLLILWHEVRISSCQARAKVWGGQYVSIYSKEEKKKKRVLKYNGKMALKVFFLLEAHPFVAVCRCELSMNKSEITATDISNDWWSSYQTSKFFIT